MTETASSTPVYHMMACYKPMATFLAMGIFLPFLWLCALLLVPFVLLFMCQAGYRAFGLKYAVGHLLLALLLCPFFGLGLFTIPLLVDSDIAKSDPAIST